MQASEAVATEPVSSGNERLSAWIQASRPLAQLNFLIPLVFGQALAWAITQQFSYRTFLLIHLFGLVDHLFIVYSNDYADADADSRNDTYQVFSGGSRVIPEGKLTRRDMLVATWITLALIACWIAYVAIVEGLGWVVPIGIFAVVLMQAYSFAPLKLSYRGGGEVLQGLGVGVVLPVIAFYLQARTLDNFPWLVTVPLFLFWYAANISSALPDAPSDAANEKRTHPVRRGERHSRRYSMVVIAIGLVSVPFVGPRLPLALGLALIVLPLFLLVRNAQESNGADAVHRERCKRFVLANCTAVNFVVSMWACVVFLMHTRWM